MDKKLSNFNIRTHQRTSWYIAHVGGSLISGGIDQNVKFDFCPKLPRLSKVTPKYGKLRLTLLKCRRFAFVFDRKEFRREDKIVKYIFRNKWSRVVDVQINFSNIAGKWIRVTFEVNTLSEKLKAHGFATTALKTSTGILSIWPLPRLLKLLINKN